MGNETKKETMTEQGSSSGAATCSASSYTKDYDGKFPDIGNLECINLISGGEKVIKIPKILLDRIIQDLGIKTPSLSLENDNYNLANMLTKAERERDELRAAIKTMVEAKGRYNTQTAMEYLISLLPNVKLTGGEWRETSLCD